MPQIRRPSFVSPYLAIILLFTLATPMLAQNFQGAISGTITDQSGALVPGVNVTITEIATGQVHNAVSSSAGIFTVPNLPPGAYAVLAQMAGFQTVRINNVPVSAGAVYSLDIKLTLAAQSTTVQVNAAGLALDTTSTTQTGVIPTKAILDIPLNGRDYTQLIALTPGYAGYATTAGSGRSMNGTRPNQKNYQVDGSDNNDPWSNNVAINQAGVKGIPGIELPIDSIDQFTVSTQGSAELGRNAGGNINVVLKSGTNMLHGSAYYFNRNQFFAARSPFLAPGSAEEKRSNQQYGFSLGGPFIKNKFFYFVNLEKQQFIFANTARATEPSIAYQDAAERLISTYNAAYGGYSVNPVSETLLNTLWPTSILDGPANANNYSSPGNITGYSYNSLGKLDYSLTSKQTLSARYFNGQGIQTAPISSQIPYYYRVGPFKEQNYSIVWNAAFSPRVANRVVAGANWFHYVAFDQDHTFNPITLGLNTEVNQSALPGAPEISISGFDPIGITNPSGRVSSLGMLSDTLSYSVGKHLFSFGGEYRRVQVNPFYYTNARGSFTVDGTQGPWATRPLPGVNPTDNNVLSLADFLLGYFSSASISRGNPVRVFALNTFNAFSEDTWSVTPRLHLNLGVRWDYFGPPHDSRQDLSTFLPSTGTIAFQGATIANLYPQDWNSVAPRIGISYQPPGANNLVVRAGFGVFFDQPNMASLFDNATSNGGASGVGGNPAGPNPVTSTVVNGCLVSGVHQSICTFPAAEAPVFPATGALGSSLFAISQNFRNAYTENYNLNIENSLGPNLVIQIGYVGSSSRKLISIVDANQAALGSGGTNSTRPNPNYSFINTVASIGTGNYNSLQATLKTASWHGLVSNFAYTWGHSLDEVSSYSGVLPQNSNDFMGDYGNMNYDVRNTLAAYFVYTIPGSQGRWRLFSNGWETSGILSIHSGQPINIVAGQNISGTAEFEDRVNRVPGVNPFEGAVHHIVNHSAERWITSAAFTNPPAGTFGTMRRNQIYGPGYNDMDLSIFKNTPINERVSTQLRFELYNLYNRINLAAPNASLISGSFGESTDTIGDAMGSPSIGAGEPFNMQLALKIIF